MTQKDATHAIAAAADGGARTGPVGAASFDVARFCRRFLAEGHNQFTGLRYVSHDAEHVELSMPYATALTGGLHPDAMADGTVIALLDMAGTLSVWAALGHFRPHATVDMRIDHFAVPPPGEAIFGRASCHHLDGDVARVRAIARTGSGADIAAMVASYMFTDAR